MEKRRKMYAGFRMGDFSGGKIADGTFGDNAVLEILIRGPT